MKRLLLFLLLPSFVNAMESKQLIPHEETNFFASHEIGKINLYQRNENFYVSDKNATYEVKKHEIDQVLRKIAKIGAMEKFKEAGYIHLDKHGEGIYSLKAKIRGEAGGGICAYWAYTLTKGLIYGTMGVAAGASVGAVVAASGGSVAAAAVGAGVTKAIGTGLSTAVGASGAITAASAGAGGAVVATVGAGTVAVAATGIGVSAGSAAGVVACVEGASFFVGALFAGPWCP